MGKSIQYPCTQCEWVSFNRQEFVDHEASHRAKPVVKPAEAPVQAPPQPKPEPITLSYVYKGRCPACGSPIDTLELDISDKHVVVAWCIICRKQRDQKEVPKL